MMKLRSSRMPDLKEDLVEEILVRVPATSLNRLRATCKQWNALLNDRRFTKKHFDKAENKYLDLILRGLRVSFMSVNLHGLDDNSDPCIELKGELNLNDHLYNSGKVDGIHVFHCNGLLLCIDRSTVVVLNPCTGQTKWIQTKYVKTRSGNYALGYENKKSCQDYKILRVLEYDETYEMEIYEFNSNSWRVLDIVIDPGLELQIGGMSVKGNTYWIAYDNNKDDCFLISFDFTTERFGPRVCLPVQGFFSSDVMYLSSVREERLSVLFRDEDALTIEIWLTNDITETNVITWTKFLRIDFNTQWLYNGATFFIDEENKLAVVCQNLPDSIVYIIGQDRWRIVDFEDGPFWPYILCYVPSLVRI